MRIFLTLTLILIVIANPVFSLPVSANEGFCPSQPVAQEICYQQNGIDYIAVPENASCVSSSTELPGADVAEKIWKFFTGRGYEPHHAAGIIGNISAESGLQPQRLQGTKGGVITKAEDVPRKNTGWGLVQWTPAHKFIDAVGLPDANELAVQVDFLWNQLEGNPPLPEATAGKELKGTTNVVEATKAFQGTKKAGGIYTGYERPKDQSGSLPFRIQRAEAALQRFGSSDVGPDSTSQPVPTTGDCSSLNDNGDSPFNTSKRNALESVTGDETITVTGIVLHYTAGGGDVDSAISALLNNNGCGDAGCAAQLVIDKEGEIWQVTPHLNSKGIHARGANGSTIGIEIIGRDEAELLDNPKQRAAVVQAVKKLAAIYSIDLAADPTYNNQVIGLTAHFLVPNNTHTDVGQEYYDLIKGEFSG